MAPIGKLHGHVLQPQVKAILAVSAIAGLEIECNTFEFGVTNKSPEFLRKFPLGKVPTFEDGNGFILTEGAAIARYVSSLAPSAGLSGHDVKEAALIDQWVHFAEFEIGLPANTIYAGVVRKYIPGYTSTLFDFYKEFIGRPLKFLEDFLATRESGLLVGDRLTLADIFVATATQRAGVTVCGAHERENVYPRVFAHFQKVATHLELQHLFKEPALVESSVTFEAVKTE